MGNSNSNLPPCFLNLKTSVSTEFSWKEMILKLFVWTPFTDNFETLLVLLWINAERPCMLLIIKILSARTRRCPDLFKLLKPFTQTWFQIMILSEVSGVARGISRISKLFLGLRHPSDTRGFLIKKTQSIWFSRLASFSKHIYIYIKW